MLVVSTSSVVWSQVRRFFILEYFCAINHGERIEVTSGYLQSFIVSIYVQYEMMP